MTFPQLLQQRVTTALAALGHTLPEGFTAAVDQAADARFGDYQTNAAMVLAKALKTNPRALATELAAAYATAFLEGTGSAERESLCDAVTLNPYLGADSIEPFLRHPDGGVFVLCRTSNSGGDDFQSLLVDGQPLSALLRGGRPLDPVVVRDLMAQAMALPMPAMLAQSKAKPPSSSRCWAAACCRAMRAPPPC